VGFKFFYYKFNFYVRDTRGKKEKIKNASKCGNGLKLYSYSRMEISRILTFHKMAYCHNCERGYKIEGIAELPVALEAVLKMTKD